MADPKTVMRTLIEAFESRDATRAMDLLTDDATVEADIARIHHTDKRPLRELLSEVLSAYEWIRVEPRMLLSNGHQAAYLADVTARFLKDINVFGRTVATAGHIANIQTAFFLEINDEGKITWFVRVG